MSTNTLPVQINEVILVGTKEKEMTPEYKCSTGNDRNKPCDDRVYNSDLDTTASYEVKKDCVYSKDALLL